MQHYNSFSEFLTVSRKSKGITSLKMAEMIGISPGYYCDIEKGRKYNIDRMIIERIISALGLSNEDKGVFYDLLGKAQSGISPDIPDYIKDNKYVQVVLRIASNVNADENDWKQFEDILKRKGQKND